MGREREGERKGRRGGSGGGAGSVRKGRGLGRDRERETKEEFFFRSRTRRGRDGDIFAEGAANCSGRWSEYGASIGNRTAEGFQGDVAQLSSGRAPPACVGKNLIMLLLRSVLP